MDVKGRRILRPSFPEELHESGIEFHRLDAVAAVQKHPRERAATGANLHDKISRFRFQGRRDPLKHGFRAQEVLA